MMDSSFSSRCLRAASLAVAMAALLQPVARAQAQRDPTMAPAAPRAPGATGDASAPAADADPMTVVVRDGRAYLVVGTRLLALGQKLGEARIERIGETEIWLREGGVLRKIQRYPGVRRVTATRIQP